MNKEMERSGLREQLQAQFARVGKALASPARLEILHLLSQGEKPVEHIARMAGLTVANASQHLQQLKSVRMVTSRKTGQQVRYSLAALTVASLINHLHEFGNERLLEVQELVTTHLTPLNGQPPVAPEDAARMIGQGQTIPVDIRPKDEYQSGHLPGAVSVPFEDLEKHLSHLSREKSLLVYAHDIYSEKAYQAVHRFREAGFNAFRMDGGVADWMLAGQSVVSQTQA